MTPKKTTTKKDPAPKKDQGKMPEGVEHEGGAGTEPSLASHYQDTGQTKVED